MSAHQTGVVVPFGSGGFSPARGRPGARACSCWRGLGGPEPVRNLTTSQSKLLKWFGTAWPGERFTYHIGNLAADRATETSQLSPTDRAELAPRANTQSSAPAPIPTPEPPSVPAAPIAPRDPVDELLEPVDALPPEPSGRRCWWC
jgi:hypothetical protein